MPIGLNKPADTNCLNALRPSDTVVDASPPSVGPAELNGLLTSPLRSIQRANRALRSSDSGVTPVGQSCDDGRGCGDESETSHLSCVGGGVSGQYLFGL
jgi:hypothetical protein